MSPAGSLPGRPAVSYGSARIESDGYEEAQLELAV
jgi:hypothetical protein